MSAKFSVLWSNNRAFTRPMSKHTFRLRDLGLPMYQGATVHLDQVQIIFRPTTGDGAIDSTEYQGADNDTYPFHTECDNLMVRCTPGVRYPLFVGDDPLLGDQSLAGQNAHRPYGTDTQHVQRVCTYSAALSTTPNQVGDDSYWVRTYRPIRDLPVLTDPQANLSEWTLELFFPYLLGDAKAIAGQVPDYRILKVYCEFSLHW